MKHHKNNKKKNMLLNVNVSHNDLNSFHVHLLKFCISDAGGSTIILINKLKS